MRIGITGHQQLADSSAWLWVGEQFDKHLRGAPLESTALTSLARGADQLFAEIAMRLGWKVHAIIPCAKYEETFTNPDDLERYTKPTREPVFHDAKRFPIIDVIGNLGYKP